MRDKATIRSEINETVARLAKLNTELATTSPNSPESLAALQAELAAERLTAEERLAAMAGGRLPSPFGVTPPPPTPVIYEHGI